MPAICLNHIHFPFFLTVNDLVCNLTYCSLLLSTLLNFLNASCRSLLLSDWHKLNFTFHMSWNYHSDQTILLLAIATQHTHNKQLHPAKLTTGSIMCFLWWNLFTKQDWHWLVFIIRCNTIHDPCTQRYPIYFRK